MKPKVYKEGDAAKIMEVSAGTLARWRRGRKIRHWRQRGRVIRYTTEDIQLNLDDMAAMRPKPVSQSPVSEARFG